MRKNRVLIVSLIMLMTLLSPLTVISADGFVLHFLPVHVQVNFATNANRIADEVIIQYKESVTSIEKSNHKIRNVLSQKQNLPMANTELVKINNGRSVDSVIRALSSDPAVVSVQPNFLYYPSTNDTFYSLQWGLENNGQLIYDSTGVVDIDIDAPEAWANYTVDHNIIVAVIDTGTDISHPDLESNIWLNPGEMLDGLDNDKNGYVDDINGWNFYGNNRLVFSAIDGDDHGTHCSGVIAATSNNSSGIAGIASGVKIMPLKFLGPDGGSTANAIQAIYYAKEMGASLASNSWGGGSYDDLLRQAIQDFDKPFVVAAGNNTQNIDRTASYPASYDCANIISVAAVDNKGALASFSNYGKTTVDVGAPGVLIASTTPADTYTYMSGTSMAAPHVSGIVALMLGINPSLTGTRTRELVISSSVPLASLARKVVSNGLANALNAAIASEADVADAPAENISVESVTVTSANNVTSVKLFKTLQMYATILPANATDKSITWSVVPGTGGATITTTGLLKGTKRGTVTVCAKNIASGIENSMEITVR